MIKAVIFDMYETLITLFESSLYMGEQIAEEIGISETKFREIWNPSDADRTIGKRTLEDVIEEILRVNDRYSQALFDTIIEKRKRSRMESFEHIHPEILFLLKQLQERDIKIGLITNCYYEERDVIVKSELFQYFDAVCMSCEMGIMKPDTKIFHACMDELSVAPNECLYVGDGGSKELETAQLLGMHPIQAVWYFKESVKEHQMPKKDDFTQAESPMDILKEIEKHKEY